MFLLIVIMLFGYMLIVILLIQCHLLFVILMFGFMLIDYLWFYIMFNFHYAAVTL
jgi:hypothetical protein